MVSETGEKDTSAEKLLATLEGEAAHVVRAIIEQARSSQRFYLSESQKRIWYLFFLMQWRRTPENQKQCISDNDVAVMLDDLLEELRIIAPHRRDEIDICAREGARDRIIRNVRVQSLFGLSDELMNVLKGRGIAIIRIVRPRKQFLIGSRPVVKFTNAKTSDLNDPSVEMWLPISSDMAVGVGQGHNEVRVFNTWDSATIRSLNLAIAKQSVTIASGSEELINSIINAR